MHAAVLCPGPSLTKHLPLCDGYGLTIGVNRAATLAPCDVWAALDYPMIRDFTREVVGSPLLLTRKQTWEDIGSRCGLKLAATTDAMRDVIPIPEGKSWTLYSATNAIVYAALRGASRVDVYGADMTGTQGFDKADKGENRSEERWKSERVIYDALVSLLAERGCVVERCLSGLH